MPGPPGCAAGPGHGLPVTRWSLLAALLLAEVLGLSVAFDAGVRADDPGWSGAILYWSPRLLRTALPGAVAVAAFAAWRLRDDLRSATRSGRQVGAPSYWLAGHLITFALFAAATDRVLGRDTAGAEVGGWALAVWAGSGGLAVALLAAAAVPPRAWPPLARRGRGALAAAACLAAAAGFAGWAAQQGWDVLSGPTLRASHRLLLLADADAVCDPAARELGTPGFRVQVAPACSGYEGMGLMAVGLAAYLWYFRRELRFPGALLLLPLGLGAAWAANVGRIVALVLIGDRVSPELALGGFHSQAGWLAFNAVVLGVLFPARRLGLFARQAPADLGPPSTGTGATVAYLAPFLAALGLQMLAESVLPDPNALYPVRAAVAAAVLGWFWPRYDGLGGPGPARTPARGFAWSVAVGVAVFVVWLALVPAAGSSAALARGPREPVGWVAAGWLAARTAGYVLVTPIVEELAFRGYLMRRMAGRDFRGVPYDRCRWPAVLVSSALFGLLHGQWLAGGVAGLGYALVAARTGMLRYTVVSHAVTNGMLFCVSAGTGLWYD